MAKAFAFEVAQRLTELRGLLPDNMRTKIPVRAPLVAFMANLLREIEHDCHRQAVVFSGQGHKRLAGLGLNIRCIDHSQACGSQPFRRDEMKHLEGILGSGLIIFIITHQTPAIIRRDNLGRLEVLPVWLVILPGFEHIE